MDKTPAKKPSNPLDSGSALQAVINKLSSQALLFGLGIAVILFVTWATAGPESLPVVLAIVFIFLISFAGYLFAEERKRLDPPQQDNHNPVPAASSPPRQAADTASAEPFKIDLRLEGQAVSATARDIKITSNDKNVRLHIGDKINICFSSTHDAYLTLLNMGSSGALTILFPNAKHPNNQIKAHKIYQIPGNEYGFDYVLNGPAGHEQIKAIATLDDVRLVEADFSDNGQLFQSREATVAARDIKVVHEKTAKMDSSRLSEATIKFLVEA